jgi:DNA-binding GntR family transcriptional regulator
VWAPGDETIDGLYLANERQHASIRAALAAGSPDGARALAREHVLASFRLLETILAQVGRALVDPRPPARGRLS